MDDEASSEYSGHERGICQRGASFKGTCLYFDNHVAMHLSATSTINCTSSGNFQKLTIEYVRATGLVGSATLPALADSPDKVIALSNAEGDLFVAGVEIKTMNPPNKIEAARKRLLSFSELTIVKNIGNDSCARDKFLKLVPTPAYRSQCLHHTCIMNVKHVLFVVAKSRSCGVGEINYATLLQFSTSIQSEYIYCI